MFCFLNSTWNNSPNLFFAGGRILSVRGEFFDSVSSSNLIVYDQDGALYESSCHVYNARLMECKTPSVKKALEKRSSLPSSLSLRIGLKMDNVTSLLQLHNPYTGRGYQLLYVQDPAYANFTNSLKIFNGGDTLVIEGNRLSTGLATNSIFLLFSFCKKITDLPGGQINPLVSSSDP